MAQTSYPQLYIAGKEIAQANVGTYKLTPRQKRVLNIRYNDSNQLVECVNDKSPEDVKRFNNMLNILDAIREGRIQWINTPEYSKQIVESTKGDDELHLVYFFVDPWPVDIARQRAAKLALFTGFEKDSLPQKRNEVIDGKLYYKFSVDEITRSEAEKMMKNNPALFHHYHVVPNKLEGQKLVTKAVDQKNLIQRLRSQR